MSAVFRTLSDPEAVWVVNDQRHQEHTIEALRNLAPRGTVYAGVGCLANLDFVSARLSNPASKITDIIIFDCSEKVKRFWEQVCPLFEEENAWAFYGNFRTLMFEEESYYFAYTQQARKNNPKIGAKTFSRALCTKHLEKLLENYKDKISFTRHQNEYSKIRDIFRNKRFNFVHLNICDFPKMISFISFLKSCGSLDTFYISNILECLPLDKRLDYEEFVYRLPKSICIAAEILSPKDVHSTQYVYDEERPPTHPTAAFLKKLQVQNSAAYDATESAPIHCSLDLESNKFSVPIQFVDYFGNLKQGSRIVCTFEDKRKDPSSTSAYCLVRKKLDPLFRTCFPLRYSESFFNRSLQEVDPKATEDSVAFYFTHVVTPAANDLEAQEKIKLHFEYEFSPASFVAIPILKSI